ncbi:MAG: PP2C family protein-serine/threonine phosphatase [Acidimicrobiales bacterium]
MIGDVCGKGPGAAAVTGLFRHTLRAVALTERSPAGVLRGTNDAILGRIEDTRFCTAALVKLDTSAGRALATVACGGHPRPLVVRATGSVEPVEVSGTLLGVLPDPVLPEVEVELGVGDAIVLFTDGVTEARRGEDLFGEARLRDVLTEAVRAGVVTSAGLADSIVAAIDDYQDGVGHDDTAIVVLASLRERSSRSELIDGLRPADFGGPTQQAGIGPRWGAPRAPPPRPRRHACRASLDPASPSLSVGGGDG